MEYLLTEDDDFDFSILHLIGNGCDAGDDLMEFMEDALSEDSSEYVCDSTVNTEVPIRGMNDAKFTMLINELKSLHTAKLMFLSSKEVFL